MEHKADQIFAHDYKTMFIELVARMHEEEIIRMVRRCEMNAKEQTPLSHYLRIEIKKRRTT
jgi:hypothetical protein